jgi:hypothetical protein
MFTFVLQNLQRKWNKIRMKQRADGKHMENDCFPRTLKYKMYVLWLEPPSDEKKLNKGIQCNARSNG